MTERPVTKRPAVGIIVVDYNGGQRTLDCLERLHALTYPAESLRVVLVDNASDEPVTANVATRWPDVDVVRTRTNGGFAGGGNAGFDHLLGRGDIDYIALVNNDALPDPGWLEPLVDALDDDPRLGAATPKVLLMGRFVGVDIRSAASRAGGGDARDLGVQLVTVRVNGRDATNDAQFASGFWGWEHDDVMVGGRFRWTTGDARLLVPVHTAGTTVELAMASGLGPRTVTVRCGGRSVESELTERPTAVALDDVGPGVDIVNNAGTARREDGSSIDRGFLEADGVPYDDAVEVMGWSGAAVLLRASYARELGGFDERFFLYYEDADMAWRGRLAGWRYRYVPASVVRHEHSATAGSAVALVHHLTRRNRLVMLTKCGDARTAAREIGALARDVALAGWRDVVVASIARRRRDTTHVKALGQVVGGYVRLLPHALRERRRLATKRG